MAPHVLLGLTALIAAVAAARLTRARCLLFRFIARSCIFTFGHALRLLPEGHPTRIYGKRRCEIMREVVSTAIPPLSETEKAA